MKLNIKIYGFLLILLHHSLFMIGHFLGESLFELALIGSITGIGMMLLPETKEREGQ